LGSRREQAAGEDDVHDVGDGLGSSPVALELAGERYPSDGLGPRLDDPVEPGAVGVGGGAAHRVDDGEHLEPRPHGVERGERQADLGPQRDHDQLVATGRLDASSAALRPDSGVYGATKYAVNYLTQAMRQELEHDDIRITSLAPGVVATNFARNLDSETVKDIGALAGLELDIEPGERLPDQALVGAQAALERFIAKPDDIADAVLYIVSLPLRLNVANMVIRPAKQLDMP
jgi:NAD(P)-dependent dehydrogenase (short-subunit alcohol dehydrogenase family)